MAETVQDKGARKHYKSPFYTIFRQFSTHFILIRFIMFSKNIPVATTLFFKHLYSSTRQYNYTFVPAKTTRTAAYAAVPASSSVLDCLGDSARKLAKR